MPGQTAGLPRRGHQRQLDDGRHLRPHVGDEGRRPRGHPVVLTSAGEGGATMAAPEELEKPEALSRPRSVMYPVQLSTHAGMWWVGLPIVFAFQALVFGCMALTKGDGAVGWSLVGVGALFVACAGVAA